MMSLLIFFLLLLKNKSSSNEQNKENFLFSVCSFFRYLNLMKRNFFKIFQFQINFKEYFRFFFVFEWNIIIINVVFFVDCFCFLARCLFLTLVVLPVLMFKKIPEKILINFSSSSSLWMKIILKWIFFSRK